MAHLRSGKTLYYPPHKNYIESEILFTICPASASKCTYKVHAPILLRLIMNNCRTYEWHKCNHDQNLDQAEHKRRERLFTRSVIFVEILAICICPFCMVHYCMVTLRCSTALPDGLMCTKGIFNPCPIYLSHTPNECGLPSKRLRRVRYSWPGGQE
jgi:hypothetical protein